MTFPKNKQQVFGKMLKMEKDAYIYWLQYPPQHVATLHQILQIGRKI